MVEDCADGGSDRRPKGLDSENAYAIIYTVSTLRFAKGGIRDLRRIRAFDRRRMVEATETQLSEEPTAPTRNRKVLVNLLPPWGGDLPVWELRVGEYRVFYDVAEDEEVVYLRAIRKKSPGPRTEEIL